MTKAYPCRYDDSFKEKDIEQVENEVGTTTDEIFVMFFFLGEI